MKNLKHLIIIGLVFFSCSAQEPTTFSKEALNDTFVTLQGENVTFKSILEAHKGSTLVIDIWASWCKDCIGGMPKVKALQQAHPEVTYIFLSLDKTQEAWKKGIEKYDVQGNHYFMQSGWKGPFGNFVALDWIPRYMVVDKDGNIKLYKAIEADDQNIKNVL
ncbi:alkyl hydroperoxide reductase [Yeosuana aromativorans]|uniref:Alkyl hydroperoxide reductase n=1 Tax=Yeosuana aromativorans TaxID=288019 RepID=A0A8J3FF24_9FLAO|nr:TlpA disulfide reductase family protein [Yeosuana aromativorans]GGK19361.1 alkyl hydroperoxide reductase [Yeosuana aromativorans]